MSLDRRRMAARNRMVITIRDQHDPAYRLLFYLVRLPIADEYQDLDLHELSRSNDDMRTQFIKRCFYDLEGNCFGSDNC